MNDNTFTQIKRFSTIVADSGDLHSIKRHLPQDATTNPSLVLSTAKHPENALMVKTAIGKAANASDFYLQIILIIGTKIAAAIPGRVSVEVDAALSFDVQATVQRAQQIVAAFANNGVPKERLLIKIAATWEGIQAATVLEKQAIHCNLTLLFSLTQAIACADAGVTLISPFVGRITDWYKTYQAIDHYPIDQDPGVQSVRQIYAYYKKHGYKTEVMAASFRSTSQIIALAGCDLLTIAPSLLAKLTAIYDTVHPTLTTEYGNTHGAPKTILNESAFRWQLNENAMATEKLAEGIRIFNTAMEELTLLMNHTT